MPRQTESQRGVLCADAHEATRAAWARAVRAHSVDADEATACAEAVAKQRTRGYRLVLLRCGLGGAPLVSEVAAASAGDTAIIVVSDRGGPRDRREALEAGARMFIDLPALDDRTIAWLIGRHVLRTTPHRFVGQSSAARGIRGRIAMLANSERPVLIVGETGVGKHLVAMELHEASPRRLGPFVHVNCAELARGLIESDLFGHERGAFTGAVQRRAGLFERATGGTLFLDEVAELPMDLQAKLLRVLEMATVAPLGGERDIMVQVRVLAATNTDLLAAVEEHRFRRDLFMRLDVLRVEVPPLRERSADIAELFSQFAARNLELTDDARELLMRYPWPGNVRELHSVAARLTVEAEADRVDATELTRVGRLDLAGGRRLRDEITERVFALANGCAGSVFDVVERDVLEEGVRRHRGNQSALARELHMDRDALRRRLGAHGLLRCAPDVASVRPEPDTAQAGVG